MAKFEAPSRGLHLELDYKRALEHPDGAIWVGVEAGDKVYVIALIQPVKKGEGGVWVISEITAK